MSLIKPKFLLRLHTGIRFIAAFCRVTSGRFIISINDSGFYLLQLSRKSIRIEWFISSGDSNGNEQCLADFIERMTQSPLVCLSPIPVFIGGWRSFHRIDRPSPALSTELTGHFDGLKADKTIVKLRHLVDSEKKRWVFTTGLDAAFLSNLKAKFKAAGIPVGKIYPITLLVLENYLKSPFSGNITIELPGDTIRVLRNNGLAIVELSGHRSGAGVPAGRDISIADDSEGNFFFCWNKPSNTPCGRCLSEIISLSSFRLKGRKSLFNEFEPDRLSRLLPTLVNALRLTGLIVLAAAFLLIISAFSLRTLKTRYERALSLYQDQYREKNELLEEISHVENEIAAAGYSDLSGNCLAGAISAFCQEPPRGLNLTDLRLSRDNDRCWSLIAAGGADREDDAFVYIHNIAQYTAGYRPELIELTRTRDDRTHSGKTTKRAYEFLIKIELAKDQDEP